MEVRHDLKYVNITVNKCPNSLLNQVTQFCMTLADEFIFIRPMGQRDVWLGLHEHIITTQSCWDIMYPTELREDWKKGKGRRYD